MKIGLSTYFLPSHPIETAMEMLAETGTRYIEVVWDLPHFSPNDPENYDLKKIRSIISSNHISVSVHAPFYDLNLGSIYREMRKFSVNRLKNCIEFSSHLGADLVVVHPGYSPLLKIKELYQNSREAFMEALGEVVQYAEPKGVKISLENLHSPYFFANTLQDLSGLAGKVENLGITLDIGHAFVMKQQDNRVHSPEEKIAREIKNDLKPFLSHVHIHDNRGGKDDHLALGRGEIGFFPIIEALKEINFSGRVIIEAWEPDYSLRQAGEQLKTVTDLFEN